VVAFLFCWDFKQILPFPIRIAKNNLMDDERAADYLTGLPPHADDEK